MENADLECDGMASQSHRPTGVPDHAGSINTSSESSESISERRSLLGKDSKQVGNYGATEIPGEQQDVVAENGGTTEVQHTPGAIAAVISVLLVGEGPLSIARYDLLICFSKVSLFQMLMAVLSWPHTESYHLTLMLSGMQVG
jgi:hypothetical protein